MLTRTWQIGSWPGGNRFAVVAVELGPPEGVVWTNRKQERSHGVLWVEDAVGRVPSVSLGLGD